MNKRYVILFIFLGISISLIIFSLNVARENLNEAVITKKQKAAFIETAKQKDIFSKTRMPSEITKEKEEEKAEAQEFILLSEIPDEYFEREEKVEKEEGYEEGVTPERKIRKQPSLKELRELKRKGAIIY
jgi:hypothetical protein